MMKAGASNRGRLAVMVVLLCALVASLAVTAVTAAAEPGDSAEIRPISDGGFGFPDIRGPEAPEEYPFQYEDLSPEFRARQVSDQEIVFEHVEGGYTAWTIAAQPAHDQDGATVPTTVELSEDEVGPVVTLIVHYRAGNPAAGGAPFAFPVVGGKGWEGGFRTISVEMNNPTPPVPPSTPVQYCSVPPLRGLSLHAATSSFRLPAVR